MRTRETGMAREKLIVVEDEQDILELLRFNLSREGYLIACAASGEEALDLVRSEAPDLVLLDLMLPGIDGLEVARHLKRGPETRHIPIIMLTAKAQEEEIVRGLEMGADDYIPSPSAQGSYWRE